MESEPKKNEKSDLIPESTALNTATAVAPP